jgi:uncharacterized membrane protein YagU involved in acid resistance
MFIGHIGFGLGLKKIDPTINVGWLIGAAFLLDIILWLFVFVNLEGVRIPADYASKHYLFFDFPYSHSLIASIIWSVVVYALSRSVLNNTRSALLLSLAVFSHFLLDVLVHPAQIPLLGEQSPKIGFGLWNSLYLELVVEILLLFLGFWMYCKTVLAKKRILWILGIVLLLVTGITVGGQLAGPAPESGFQVAISSFSLILLLTFIFLYFDKKTTST